MATLQSKLNYQHGVMYAQEMLETNPEWFIADTRTMIKFCKDEDYKQGILDAIKEYLRGVA